MLEAILANGVRTIVVEQLTRVARDVGVQENIIKDLRSHGITIVSATEDLDLMSDDPARVAMRQMLGVFSQYEKAMLVAKLRAARRRKRQTTGRCEGAKPYGHHPKYPNEPATLATMVRLRAAGTTLQGIADALNDSGIRPRRGQRWGVRSIAGILGRQPKT
jgi:DNA invertase Pin-like site-specific DNA recombinase